MHSPRVYAEAGETGKPVTMVEHENDAEHEKDGRKPTRPMVPDVPTPPNRNDLDIERTEDVHDAPNQGEIDPETAVSEPPD